MVHMMENVLRTSSRRTNLSWSVGRSRALADTHLRNFHKITKFVDKEYVLNLRCVTRLALIFVFIIPQITYAGPVAEQMRINQKRYGIAGQVVLIAHNGDVLLREAQGAQVDDIFPVYSLSKLFVSTLIMQLVEQGKIDLERPVSLYLNGLPSNWQTINVRQLLNHTSGLPEYFDNSTIFPATINDVLTSLVGKPLIFQPGTAVRYTQTNYAVLTILLEMQYAKPYVQIARERIIEPLGMKHTYLGAPSLPGTGVITAYASKNGTLQKADDIRWPPYSYGHAELYSNVDDLARFLMAVSTGKLVGKQNLQKFWEPPRLSNGQPGVFATGWEFGESGSYRHVGHDGGTQVRVRMLYQDTLDGDNYTFIYLTNGSVKNVWSRVLLDSAMSAVAPNRFKREAFSEKLIAFGNGETSAPPIDGIPNAERAINAIGYAVRENLGLDEAIRVFALNSTLFPNSANTWDSLAETYRAKGEEAKAKHLYEKARQLSVKPSDNN